MRLVTENYGDSELARRFGVTRYPAIFVDDILVAKPKDFGFYGNGEGGGDGRYTPWKDPGSHEHFRTDLKRMLDLVLAGDRESLRKEGTMESIAEITGLPDFKYVDLSGEPLARKDLEGRVVLVEFWATWCPPCRGTLVWLGDLQKRYGEKLAVLALAVESDETEVKKVTGELNLPLRWIMGNPDIARSYGDISAVPTLFLFDRNGRIADTYYGAPPELHEIAEKAIRSLVH